MGHRPLSSHRKVTDKEFDRFKKEFEKQITRLNLSRFTIQFMRDNLSGAVATIDVCRTEMHAVVTLCDSVHRSTDNDWPEKTAKHESAHLLIADLSQLARERFNVSDNEIYRCCEAICNALESVL